MTIILKTPGAVENPIVALNAFVNKLYSYFCDTLSTWYMSALLTRTFIVHHMHILLNLQGMKRHQ